MKVSAKTVRAGFLLVFLCAAALLLGACDELITIEEKAPVVVDDGNEPNLSGTCNSAQPGDDTDGDGLSNCEELVIGTSPRLADTDGDGFSDFEEIVEFGFSPTNNNFQFNPLIADVPKFSLEIVSVPSVIMVYETSAGTTQSISTERTLETATTLTTGATETNAHSVEMANSVGAGLTVGTELSSDIFGPEFTTSIEFSVNYEFTHSTTDETSFSYSKEQAVENRQAVTEAQSFEESNEITTSGGTLSLAVRVRNQGSIAFRTDNLLIGAVTVDPLIPGLVIPIGNLSIDAPLDSFPVFTLAPGESTGNLVFLNDGLDVGTAKTLLKTSKNLIMRVGLSELVGADGVAFAFEQTAINAKDATIIVDYGGKRATERHLVATNVNAATLRVTLPDVLNNILRMPYTTDSVSGVLTSVRGIAADPALSAFWLVILISDDGLEKTLTKFAPTDVTPLFFNGLDLQSGDVLHLIFLEDADGDLVGLRQEFAAGTDPTNMDTDGDGLDDGVELAGFLVSETLEDGSTVLRTFPSDPNIVDTDGDGLTDFEEVMVVAPAVVTNPRRADTDNDLITDPFDPAPTVFNDFEIVNFTVTNTQNPVTIIPDDITITWTQPTTPPGKIYQAVLLKQLKVGNTPFRNEITDSLLGVMPVGKTFACGDLTVCYTIIGVSNTPGTFTVTDQLTTADQEVQYTFLIQLIDQIDLFKRDAFQSQQLRQTDSFPNRVAIDLTINFLWIACGDDIGVIDLVFDQLWSNDDHICELYWRFFIDGVMVNQKTKPNLIEVDTPFVSIFASAKLPPLPLNDITGVFVAETGDFALKLPQFERPDIAGNCFEFKAVFLDDDTDISSDNGINDPRGTIIRQFCRDDPVPWGDSNPAQGVLQGTLHSFGVGYDAATAIGIFFTIDAPAPPPP